MLKIKKIVNDYDLYQLLQYGNDNEYDREINQILLMFNHHLNENDFTHRIWEIFSPYKDVDINHYQQITYDLLRLRYPKSSIPSNLLSSSYKLLRVSQYAIINSCLGNINCIGL